MQKEAFAFFENTINRDLPLLVALSGGPDSMALLHLLLKWGKVKIHIAHVDHGWRLESAQECEALKEMAARMSLPFHAKRLAKKYSEEESRQERYRFFKEVANLIGASGVVLGHHRDDLSETVFKRVLEGASLWSLSGMHKVRRIDGLTLYRPLLASTKKEVVDWLEKQGIAFFIDPTNLSGTNLRATCRNLLFPSLKDHFNKEFEGSLARVGEDSEDLYHYLVTQVKPYIENQVVGPWGVFLEKLPKERVELKFILRQLSNKVLSRSELDTIVKLVEQKSANKVVSNIYIDRERLFFAIPSIADLEGSLVLKEGVYAYGPWQISVERTSAAYPIKNHFRDAWRGELATIIPEGEYRITKGLKKMKRVNKDYGDYLNQQKIPHFLASKVPVIVRENEIIEDFLSERKPPCNERNFMVHCTMMMAKNLD